MKVKKEVMFTPITIVIESQEEKEAIYAMSSVYINNGMSEDVRKVAKALNQELSK